MNLIVIIVGRIYSFFYYWNSTVFGTGSLCAIRCTGPIKVDKFGSSERRVEFIFVMLMIFDLNVVCLSAGFILIEKDVKKRYETAQNI